jgi:hypothetical protein
MLLWIGAALSGYLGYRLLDWWVPAALACATVAIQAFMFRGSLGAGGSLAELLALSLLLDLAMFYATFSIGRSIGQRRSQRRKGAR